MLELGLSAAVWLGRERPDPDKPSEAMCLALDAVKDALAICEDIEASVCGNPENSECCPFHRVCGYQRQKAVVSHADVVVAAHNMLFHTLAEDHYS